ncbi:MAG: hypothetical protein ACI9ZD_001163, partial [Paracoccaceae bacterium]
TLSGNRAAPFEGQKTRSNMLFAGKKFNNRQPRPQFVRKNRYFKLLSSGSANPIRNEKRPRYGGRIQFIFKIGKALFRVLAFQRSAKDITKRGT